MSFPSSSLQLTTSPTSNSSPGNKMSDLERIGSRTRDNSHQFAAESEALDQIAKDVRNKHIKGCQAGVTLRDMLFMDKAFWTPVRTLYICCININFPLISLPIHSFANSERFFRPQILADMLFEQAPDSVCLPFPFAEAIF